MGDCELLATAQMSSARTDHVELRAEAVSFRYTHFELSTADLMAHAGQVVAIIGPNGSGKSTLLEILSGHLRPQAGRVLLNGRDLHRMSPRDRAQRVGLARQETILLFSFTVREFVRQGRHPHIGRGLFESSEDEQYVDWAMEKTNLTQFGARGILEISSGEFQRAVLARTLAQRPQLILLDEPTANLDIGYQIDMFRLLRDVVATEKCIAVVVTHELNLAAELADYVLLLDGGQCLRQGTPEQVFDAELLSRVFRTPVMVDRNPSSERPRATWVMSHGGIPPRA